VSDQALRNLDHVAGAVLAQSHRTSAADGERYGCPPAEAVIIASDGLDRDVPLQASQPPELLADHGCFELALCDWTGVLPVTAAAAVRAGVAARHAHSIRGWGQDLYRIGPSKSGCGLGYPGDDAFTRQGVPNEYHPARIIGPGHAPSAMHDLAYG
jgi:hypothetical protein